MFYSKSFDAIIRHPKFVGHIHSLLSQGFYPPAIHSLVHIYLDSQNIAFDEAELERFIFNNKWLFLFFRCAELLTVLELRAVITNLDVPLAPQQAEYRWGVISRKHDREISDGYRRSSWGG